MKKNVHYPESVLKKLKLMGLIELANRNKLSSFFNIFAFVICMYMSPLSNSHLTLCALLLVGILLFGAIRTTLCFSKIQEKYISTIWYELFFASTVGMFGIWSYWLCLNIYVLGMNPSIYFSSLMMAGLCSGAVMSLVTSRALMNSVAVITVVPSIFMLIFLNQKESIMIAIMFSVYIAFLYSLIKQANFSYISSIMNRELSDQSRQVTERILDSIPGFVSSIDHQLNYVWTNKKLNEKFSLKVSTDVKTLGSLMHDESFIQRIKDFISANGNVDQFDCQLTFPDGPFWMKIFLSRYQEFGEGRVLIIAYDIEDAKKAEMELEKQRVTVIESSKLAILGEMSAGVAHEINNPLTLILGKVYLMTRELSSGKMNNESLQVNLEKISKAGDRIAKIVSGMKTFSRDGEKDPFETVNVEKLVQDVLSFTQERFKNKNIELKLDIDAQLSIHCRATQIEQVLLNLLGNAYDAIAETKDPWLFVQAKSVESGFAEISITDSGGGIEPKILEKIMQPFFTTKEVGKGTGLGLSISLGIIKSHQGEFKYDSNSKNTRFVIRIPQG